MLALEVKDIMNEVSKLKEERNRIQQEIADLINVRSKMAGGFCLLMAFPIFETDGIQRG